MSDWFPIVAFALSSSSLLVLNKACVRHFGLPSLLSAIQFACAALWPCMLHLTGRAVIDPLDWRRTRAFLLYITIFTAAIYSNMRALQYWSVETIIMCRSCCPMLVCLLEALVLNRELPSRRAMCTLLALFASAAGYAVAESSLSSLRTTGAEDATSRVSSFASSDVVTSMLWLSSYYVFICLSDTHGKLVLNQLSWRSMWGPVLYTNALSLPPMLVAAAATGELHRLRAFHEQGTADLYANWKEGLLPLSLTCVASVLISYYGWRSRQLCTATTYTILGVANKLLSIMGSALLTGKALSPTGALCLICCLLLAASYRPAPMRSPSAPKEKAS